MTNTSSSASRRWIEIDADLASALERCLEDRALAFFKSADAAVAKRIQSEAVKAHSKKLIRDLILSYNLSMKRLKEERPADREAASATAKKLRSFLETLESIPDAHQQQIASLDADLYELLFSSDGYNRLSRCHVHFLAKSWTKRGRPADIVMQSLVSSCVHFLEFITERPFRQNFHSEKTSSGKAFTSSDCAFCEAILKEVNPTLGHEEIKAGIKNHFAPSRSQPLKYVGPSRKPVYVGPQKPSKSR